HRTLHPSLHDALPIDDFRKVLAVVGVHEHYPAQTLPYVLAGIINRAAGLNLSGIHAYKAKAAYERVCHYFECKRREGRVVRGGTDRKSTRLNSSHVSI